MGYSMDPVSLSAAATSLIALVDWNKVGKQLATDVATKTAKGLLRPPEAGRTRKDCQASHIPLRQRIPRRARRQSRPPQPPSPDTSDQLKRLIEHAAPDIAAWLQPETKEVDLGPVERMWRGLNLDPLPGRLRLAACSQKLRARDPQARKERSGSA